MSSIWKHQPDLNKLNSLMQNTAAANLGIEIIEIGEDYLSGTMPADHRTFQPMGIIHGGANVLLADTLGSYAANLCVDTSKLSCFGQEINANHIRAVKSGFVTGTARAIHLGRSSHVWEIRIVDEDDRLSCISRITMAIIPRK